MVACISATRRGSPPDSCAVTSAEHTVRVRPDRTTVPRARNRSPRAGLPVSPEARRSLDAADHQARALGYDAAGTDHLLLGILRTPSAAAQVLEQNGITPELAAAAARDLTTRYLRGRE
jgi:ATP-dependent Clp protease ATP-binding subunit ClpA